MIPPWEPNPGSYVGFASRDGGKRGRCGLTPLWRNEFLLPNGPLNQKGAGTDKGKTKVVS